MKLNQNIFNTKTKLKKKFEKCTPRKLKKGDYLRLHYFIKDDKKRGGKHLRTNKQTVILEKKKRRGNSLGFVVTALYKYEKVRVRFLISSLYMVHVKYLKKALSYRI